MTGNCQVKIWKQELVEIDGVLVTRVHFSATVDGVIIDTATVNIDIEALAMFLFSAEVPEITEAEHKVIGLTQTQLALAYRLELESKFCTSNVIGDADVDKLAEIAKRAMVEMDQGTN